MTDLKIKRVLSMVHVYKYSSYYSLYFGTLSQIIIESIANSMENDQDPFKLDIRFE